MFFEDDPSPQCDDPLFDTLPESNLKYVCKTRKLLKMDHAYVLPKEGQGNLYCYMLQINMNKPSHHFRDSIIIVQKNNNSSGDPSKLVFNDVHYLFF